MLGRVLKITGYFVLAVFIAVGVLANIKGPIESEVVQQNTLAKAHLDKFKDAYAKCYGAVNRPVGLGSVVFEYTVRATTPREMDRVKLTEAEYKQYIKDRCEKSISEYEANASTYRATNAKLAEASTSLLDRIIGIDNASNDSWQYSLGVVRMSSPVTGDEAGARDFFKTELGY